MPQKLPACCSRLTGRVTHCEANVRSLATKAAVHDQKGHDITKLKRLMADAKVELKNARQILVDHEAEHAGDPGLAPLAERTGLTAVAV